MTEEQKQHYLVVAKEILRQAEPQLDNTEWQSLVGRMMGDIEKETYGPLKVQLMQVPLQLMDIINSNNDRLDAYRKAVEYVDSTRADDLEFEMIGKMLAKGNPSK